MIANKLMIGDWVIVKGIPTKIHDIDEWDGINREWIAGCEDGGCICYEDIQPIPLTPEILEKNGFEWIKNKIVDEAYVLTKTFWDEEPKLIIRRFDFNESFVICTSWDNTSFMSIGYVHELQHLLKLCGIDKEIVV